jgi:hypothetical protein
VIAPPLAPVQLCLELRTRPSRRRTSTPPRPYWDHVDLADVGGELHARSSNARVILTATRRADSSWVGAYDLLLGDDGVSGTTKAHTARQDALVSAAYRVADYCRSILERKAAHPSCDLGAANHVMRWLVHLDLL